MSDRKFYYLDKGAALGPVAESELMDLIRQGHLFALDLVYFQDDVKWRPVSEFPLFKDALVHAADLQKREVQWVVLTKKDNDRKSGFIQAGPFGTSVITERLATGALRYTDYVWKKGMSEWKKINEVAEFAPVAKMEPPPSPPELLLLETPPFPQEAGESLIKNVVRKKQLESIEEVPPEAGTGDLTQAVAGNVSEHSQTGTDTRKRPTPRPVASKPIATLRARRPPTNRFVWFAVFSLTVFGFGVYFLSTVDFQKLRNQTPSPASLPVFPQPPPQAYIPPRPPSTALPSAPAHPPEPAKPPEHLRPATYAHLQFQDLQGEGAKIVVETDSNEAEIPVQMLFSAMGGEVLEKRGLHKLFRRVLIHGRNEFAVRSLHLPEGQMTVKVTLENGLTQEKSFFFGIPDQKFKERMKRHKKQVAFAYQVERQQLFQVTSQVQSDLQDLQLKLTSGARSQPTWPSYAEALMARLEKIKLREIKNDQALENVSLWADWLELRAIVQDTVTRIRSNEAPNAPAVTSKDLIDRTNRLRSRVMRSSLWRST